MSSLQKLMFVIAGIILSSGCLGGGPTEPPLGLVKGKVTVNGEPGANLQVIFDPQGAPGETAVEVGAPSQALTDAGGAYELNYKASKGAVVGMHTVRVTRAASGGPAGGEGATSLGDPIPESYNITSNITKEVKPGENTIDIEITF